MTGQDDEGDDGNTGSDVGDGVEAGVALFFLFADDQFDNCQQEGQPDHGSDKHGKDHADNQKAAKHQDHAAQKRRQRSQAQGSPQDVHVDAGQGNLQRREPAIGYL